MNKSYFLVRVEGGVEAFTDGPFGTRELRDAAAKRAHEIQEVDDAIFWANTDSRGRLEVGSYVSAFFSLANR